jgi:hypothetical protein
MPFPLAHPAAVLPLRRYCPKYLSFPALIVGSVCPDAGYCFGRLNAGGFSHRLLGSVGFCLPVGIITLLLLYRVILSAIERLPERYQRMVPPVAWRPLGTPLVILLSLIIGAWTHLLWDSFTHTNGWFVEHFSVLKTPLASVVGRTVRVCHLLWYGCSFGGMILVFIAYDRWQQSMCNSALDVKIHWRSAVLLAVLVVPIEVIHHLVQGALGSYLVVASTLVLAIGIALRIRPAQMLDGRLNPPV